MLPSPRTIGLLAAGFALAILPIVVHGGLWPLVAIGWGALAILFLLDALLLWRARVAVSALMPRQVGVGSALELRVSLRHLAPLPLRVSLLAEVEAPLVAGEPLVIVAQRGEAEHTIHVSAPRRGSARVVALWLRVDGPLRLVRAIRRVSSMATTISILPNVEKVRRMALTHFGANAFRGGLHVERNVGDGGEFESLQAYASGMDVRSVDWKASARHNALRVRRFHLEKNQQVILCLDAGRLMSDPIEGLTRLDHGVHAALLLAHAALRQGDLVGLHAYGPEPLNWVPPKSGLRHVRRLVDACATVEPTDEETNHVLGLQDLLSRLHRRALVIVFTEFVDSTTAELMVEHLGHLSRRHLLVFVALDDPAVDEPLGDLPRDAEQLAAAVVSVGLRDHRRRVLHRLARAGVDVVHDRPGRAAVQLVQHYLRIKRRRLIG